RVSAAVEGRVVSVLGDGKGAMVAEGERVRPDQVIVQLDDRVPRANRDKLAAAITELEEQQKQAGYAVELADIDVKRLEELNKVRLNGTTLPLASRVEMDRAGIARKDALSRQQAAAARLTASRAELKALDAQLDFYTLRASIAGQLGLVQAMPGQTLAPG